MSSYVWLVNRISREKYYALTICSVTDFPLQLHNTSLKGRKVEIVTFQTIFRCLVFKEREKKEKNDRMTNSKF